MSFLFFKSAIIADRPLRITEGFFNLLILLPRRAGAYLSMTRSEHFSSWLCSSSWFLHICRSRDGFFSLFSGVHTAEKETFGHERLQEQDKQPPAQQQRGFPVPLWPWQIPSAQSSCLGAVPPQGLCPGCSGPWQPHTALPNSAATALRGTPGAPNPSPQPGEMHSTVSPPDSRGHWSDLDVPGLLFLLCWKTRAKGEFEPLTFAKSQLWQRYFEKLEKPIYVMWVFLIILTFIIHKDQLSESLFVLFFLFFFYFLFINREELLYHYNPFFWLQWIDGSAAAVSWLHLVDAIKTELLSSCLFRFLVTEGVDFSWPKDLIIYAP